MKKIFLSLVLITLTLNASAQEELAIATTPKHFIGLHAGYSTGHGLSYRYWPSKFGGEITASPNFRKGGEHRVSVGLSFLYKLREHEKFTLYSYLGNSILSEKINVQVVNPNTGFTNEFKTTEEYNIGVGFGIKVNFWQNLDFNLQGGYALYDLTNDLHSNFTTEIGLYYHF